MAWCLLGNVLCLNCLLAISEVTFDCFYRFVSSVLPPANEDLKGTEVETIIKFKNALGIDDPDAASMHIEVAFVYVC